MMRVIFPNERAHAWRSSYREEIASQAAYVYATHHPDRFARRLDPPLRRAALRAPRCAPHPPLKRLETRENRMQRSSRPVSPTVSYQRSSYRRHTSTYRTLKIARAASPHLWVGPSPEQCGHGLAVAI